MSAFIEMHATGGGSVVIAADMIAGVLCAKGKSALDMGTPEAPVRVLLRGGETIDVIGEFAGKILARAHKARIDAKNRRQEMGGDPEWEFWVDWLTPIGGGDDGAE